MKRLTVTEYRKRDDAYGVSAATVRSYIKKRILKGEIVYNGIKPTYYVHIDDEFEDSLMARMVNG